jgi:hypothetical protein
MTNNPAALGVVAAVAVVAVAIIAFPAEIAAAASTVVTAGVAVVSKVVQAVQNVIQRAGPAVSRFSQAATRRGNLAKEGDQIGNLGTYVKNPRIDVNWNNVRQHALNRMDKNGITKEKFESWVKNGKAIQQDANTFMFLNREGVAV